MSDKPVKIDVAEAKKEAEKELRKERIEEAKNKFKKKLKEIEQAKLIVRNLERELEDLEREMEG